MFLLLVSFAAADSPSLVFDPVLSLPDRTPVASEGLSFSTCTATPVAPGAPTGGALVLQLRLRRGEVALVSTTHVDAAAAPYQPCVERVLASYAWTVRRGDLEVRIKVEGPATRTE